MPRNTDGRIMEGSKQHHKSGASNIKGVDMEFFEVRAKYDVRDSLSMLEIAPVLELDRPITRTKTNERSHVKRTFSPPMRATCFPSWVFGSLGL